jgi:hypothetical protein
VIVDRWLPGAQHGLAERMEAACTDRLREVLVAARPLPGVEREPVAPHRFEIALGRLAAVIEDA